MLIVNSKQCFLKTIYKLLLLGDFFIVVKLIILFNWFFDKASANFIFGNAFNAF